MWLEAVEGIMVRVRTLEWVRQILFVTKLPIEGEQSKCA